MKTKSYKDLIVWQKSIDLVEMIYQITSSFPKEETYGLALQMRRAVVAISSNIAEGYGRQQKAEYIQYLSIAYGSAAELETQIIIAKRLGYLKEPKYKKIVTLLWEILKMLGKMRSVLKNRKL